MTSDELYQKLIAKALNFVSFRPRSEKEIREFLEKKLRRLKVVDDPTFQKILRRLSELGYLDDQKFAAWWIDQRSTNKPRGQHLVTQELKAKGVSREIIVELIENTRESGGRELALAKKALEKKLMLWRRLPAVGQKKKIYAFLGRRGFAADTVFRVVDEVLGKSYNRLPESGE